jgi:hypothetical protein
MPAKAGISPHGPVPRYAKEEAEKLYLLWDNARGDVRATRKLQRSKSFLVLFFKKELLPY